MAVSVEAPARAEPSDRARAGFLPWVIPAVLFAATSAVVGVIWDISWHRTIGRDTFLTPAHIAIYLSGIVAGLSCGFLVLKTTFAGTPEERAASVRFWGFRGPLGAWVCIWGAIAMITSAPFDDWWHNAYGLDVKVLSPPHAVLALGFTAIQVGALLLLLAWQNREHSGRGPALGWLVAYGMGVLILNKSIMGFQYIAFPNEMHHALFYQVSAGLFPIFLVAGARATKLRWPATTAAGVYMGVLLVMIWVLQLFPAQPKLAPIYNPVTHMVPPPFPLLLVVPAVVIDWLMRRPAWLNDWLRAPLVALAFLAVLFVTQWFFSMFLLSPASESSFFGAQRWDYNSRVGAWTHEFWNVEGNPVTPRALAVAALIATVSARIGLWWGNWLARVKR
ncbi:MAG: hypothetical protein HYS40_03600 [Gemmatimonadetes bacterium]|nr:hypothetical protein [Gemmatimonadota bacterium]